jgi:alpha-galactosidase
LPSVILVFLLLLVSIVSAAIPAFGAAAGKKLLAATPPMGWNDWAHYLCGFTAKTILGNARALVSTGLAALGCDLATIDDCWLLKDRDASGNLECLTAAGPESKPQSLQVQVCGHNLATQIRSLPN